MLPKIIRLTSESYLLSTASEFKELRTEEASGVKANVVQL